MRCFRHVECTKNDISHCQHSCVGCSVLNVSYQRVQHSELPTVGSLGARAAASEFLLHMVCFIQRTVLHHGLMYDWRDSWWLHWTYSVHAIVPICMLPCTCDMSSISKKCTSLNEKRSTAVDILRIASLMRRAKHTDIISYASMSNRIDLFKRECWCILGTNHPHDLPDSMWESDCAYAMVRLCDTRYAMCTASKFRHPYGWWCLSLTVLLAKGSGHHPHRLECSVW